MRAQRDAIDQIRSMQKRVAAIENGSTVCRPHPKWVSEGGGDPGGGGDGTAFDLVTMDLLDFGNFDSGAGMHTDLLVMTGDGTPYGSYRYVTAFAAQATAEAPSGAPGASDAGIWHANDPDDSDYHKVWVQVAGSDRGYYGIFPILTPTGLTDFGAMIIIGGGPGSEPAPRYVMAPYDPGGSAIGWSMRMLETDWALLTGTISFQFCVEGFVYEIGT